MTGGGNCPPRENCALSFPFFHSLPICLSSFVSLILLTLAAEEKDLDDILADLCQLEEDTKAQLAAATNHDSQAASANR